MMTEDRFLSSSIGSATNFFELCHITTVFGDWGLRDEITVWTTGYGVLQFGGTVTVNQPQNLGVILGNTN